MAIELEVSGSNLFVVITVFIFVMLFDMPSNNIFLIYIYECQSIPVNLISHANS